MPRQHPYAGAIALFIILGMRVAVGGTDAINVTQPPVTPGTTGDSSTTTKFYTLSASLREEYDDNIFTAKDDKQGSFKTDFSPSILVDFPMQDSEFSARYTFDATYYSHRSGDDFDLSHEFDASYRHAFSDRFNMNVAELFRYYTEPSLFESVGTPFRSGAYYSNQVNAGFNAQWTPLVSTATSFANTVIKYENSAIADTQDNMENTGTETLGFAILPKVSLNFSGIVDNISYDDIDRGYTSYTGSTGLSWQALPSLSVSGSVGGTVTDTEQSGSSVSPYGALSVGWQLGAKSSLTFNYSHDVVPTDVTTAEGQIADRFTLGFRYDITPRLNAHTQGILTHGDYTDSLIFGTKTPSFDENDFAIDSGLTYHVNNYLDVDLGYTFSGVASDLSFRDYTRNQVYVGVRGTY